MRKNYFVNGKVVSVSERRVHFRERGDLHTQMWESSAVAGLR
jgi:hypothetical protein